MIRAKNAVTHDNEKINPFPVWLGLPGLREFRNGQKLEPWNVPELSPGERLINSDADRGTVPLNHYSERINAQKGRDMKKEFKSTEITCRFNNLLNPEQIEKATNLVAFKIRTSELETLTGDKDYRSYLELLSSSYPGVESYTDAQIKAVTTTDFDLFKAHEKLISDLKEQLEKIPVSLEDFNSLTGTDKSIILLECHKNYKGIGIEVDGDWNKAITAFFNSGSLSKVKDLFRSAFNVAVGKPGELFAGYKIRKSDFSDADIRKAVSLACGGAGRTKKKVTDPKTKEKIEKLGNYDWRIKTDAKTVSRIASELFAVVIESRADSLEQIRPEAKQEAPKEVKQDTKPETPKQEQKKQEAPKKDKTTK